MGEPCIYLDNPGRYYIKEQDSKYGFIFKNAESEEDQKRSTSKGVSLLKTPGIRETWQVKRKKILEDKMILLPSSLGLLKTILIVLKY